MKRPVGALAAAFLAVKLATLAANLRHFPTLRPVADPSDLPLLIPVRDEAARLPDTLPGLLAATDGPLVFLDDESTDGTAALLAAAARSEPRITVLTGAPRPRGWTGKTWACAQLADAVAADPLVFCDADVRLAPGAVAAVVSEMDRQRAAVFSVFCRQLTGSWGERLLMPLIDDVVLCFLPHRLLELPVPPAATASGALLAFRRSAYAALGGFAGVRGEVVEDVALARSARRLGLRLGLALGGDVARVRMYRGFGEVVAGMGRGLVPAAGGRRAAVLAGWAWHVLAYTLPAVLARRSALWASVWAAGMLERMVVEHKTGGRDWPAALLVPLSPLAAAPVVARAMGRRHEWKGRVYG